MEDIFYEKSIGLTQIFFYMGICVFYLIIMAFNGDTAEFNKYNFLIFFSVTFIVQLGLNSALINHLKICSSANEGYKMSIVIVNTITPWVLILGLGHLLIKVFPGWLRIFSNTIGMFIAYTKYEIEISPTSTNTTLNSDPMYKSLYYKALNNPKNLINEVDILDIQNEPAQISTLYNTLTKINKDIFTDANKDKIISMIKFKNNIGYGTWYVLLGLLSVMVSTNSIINSNCNSYF